MLSKENAFKVLTIRKSLNISGEPLSYNVGFGLTESCHQQLLNLSQKNGLNPSELIRMALDCVIFNENYVEMLKSQRKANNVLVHKRTVNLNKTQFNRISELSKTYGIARSEIIRKSIEEFLKKDFLHREG